MTPQTPPTDRPLTAGDGNAHDALLARLDDWGYAPGRATALEAAATIRKLMADAGRVI